MATNASGADESKTRELVVALADMARGADWALESAVLAEASESAVAVSVVFVVVGCNRAFVRADLMSLSSGSESGCSRHI